MSGFLYGVGLTVFSYGLWFHETSQLSLGGGLIVITFLCCIFSEGTWREQK